MSDKSYIITIIRYYNIHYNTALVLITADLKTWLYPQRPLITKPKSMTSDIEKMISVANCLGLISCRDREIFFDNLKINI